MSTPLPPAKLVSLINGCYICSDEYFTTPQNLRKHVLRLHDQQLPSRDARVKHKDTSEILYIPKKLKHPNVTLHFACPSCLYNSELKADLKEHVEAQHYSNKRNHIDVEQDNHQKKNCTDNISVPTTRNILAFTVMTDNLYTPHQPKLAAETVQALKPLVAISAGYNRNMNSDLKLKLDENLAAQASLASLKFFKNAYDFLKSALEKPRTSLPQYLWSQSIHTDDMEEEQIIKIIQFTLTDFAGKCNRPQGFEPKHERTFWIDKIIPIFQSIGDQTGLVGFEWCENNPESFSEKTTDLETWKHGPVRYLDGLGYRNERSDIIVMEASSGKTNEDLEHSRDDTLKNVHGSICALEAILRRHPNASFATASSLLSFTIQSICTTITLSTTALEPENIGGFLHQECRSAEVPVHYNERIKWLKVFELVSELVIMLKEQASVIDQLQKEEQSGISPTDNVKTIRSVLF